MTYLVKAIKPARMKPKEVRFEVLNALRKEGRAHVKLYKKTVGTWKKKPKFGFLISTAPAGDLSLLSGPESGGQVWEWLNRGTKGPYPIIAKKAPLLRFRTGYTAKTQPRQFSSGSGGAKGPWRSKKAVMHPGIKAREWSEEMVKTRQRPFNRNMFRAVQRGTKKLYG